MTTLTAIDAITYANKDAKELFALLNEHRLITGAWSGMPYADLPEDVQDSIAAIVADMRSLFLEGL